MATGLNLPDFSYVRDKPSTAGDLATNTMVYEFDYFSASQMSIYIGNILIDDISSIQFTVSHSKRPIYGYASQYFHTLADGQIIVEGQFSIPFKEADYILASLQRYQENQPPIKLGVPMHPKVSRDNIELYMANHTQKQTTQLYNDLAALNDQDFEDAAEKFQDMLWKTEEMKRNSKFLTGNQSINAFDILGVNPIADDYRRADQYPLFDIYILYGDLSNKAANTTIKKLIDVSILGQGQSIVISGEPIQESYNFIARNLG